MARSVNSPWRQHGRWNNAKVAFSLVPQTSVDELPADAVLLDVREDEEWVAGHAPGASHLPMSTLADRLDEVPDADPLFVICRSGGRSARVVEYLNSNGWDAVNVVDGMLGWAAGRHPLVAESGALAQVI